MQNGNHIETFKVAFPQLEFVQPHALQAFDLLVGAIENQAELPPSQCIPRGGTIAKLFVGTIPARRDRFKALNPDSRFGPHSLIGGVLATHLSDCVIKFSTIQENESDEVEKY